MNTAERIFQILNEKHMEQKKFAHQLGIVPQTVTDWKSGKSKSYTKHLPQIAEILGTTTEYLLTGAGAKTKAAPKGGNWIPVLGDVAAGIPMEAVENVVDYEEIHQAMAATGEYFGLRIKGSSMEPRIREGDVVIVRKQNDADTGDTAVVLVNGDSATVKRIKKEPDGSLWLLPNNPAYDPVHYSASEMASLPVTIIGKVVELRGKF